MKAEPTPIETLTVWQLKQRLEEVFAQNPADTNVIEVTRSGTTGRVSLVTEEAHAELADLRHEVATLEETIEELTREAVQAKREKN